MSFLDRTPLLIAELGNNHEGNLDVALRLVDAAAEAGVDAVKVQTFTADRFVRARDSERLAQMSRFELPPEAFEEIAGRAHDRGLLFGSTPLDMESVAMLEPYADFLKIASGDNDHWPLIERVAATGKPMIVSGGLVDADHLVEVERRARAAGAGELAILHCVVAYPAAREDANLAAIEDLRERLGCAVGYSDHTIGAEAARAARALGADVIEKHFTLDHEFSDFRDHALSATPDEMAAVAAPSDSIAPDPVLLGERRKQVLAAEQPLAVAVRRSIVAARPLAAGATIDRDSLTWMRPRDGLAPGEEALLIGRELARDVGPGESLTSADLR